MQRLSVPGELAPPLQGHLRLGDPAHGPDAIEVNARHLTRGGRPWFPVMGEFHYGRYPVGEWREELLKVRAGGVTAVSTYVFWNLHEERRGVFDWTGDRDLRRFVMTCAELGLDVVVRIGPWGHGESRNGGFPDWVLAADGVPRTDDPRYLELVRPLFEQIATQLQGLTREHGGPVVAVQIENELYDQPDHLLTLKRMAQRAGIDAPLWTATGWGHAQLPPDELIPVFGGYSEAAWDTAHDGWPQQSRAHYFFGPGRNDDSIGADLRTVSSSLSSSGTDESHLARYPFATCELGGGMYTSYHRRPLVTAADIAALALVKLGSGSVWQGYYMYHGASQKIGALSTLQESHATGYPNDCPVITYDFQAPLGEYGQFRDSYAYLRMQHLWLASDGPDLATMVLTMPPGAPDDTADRRSLRWAVRSDGRSGFLFVNNHQPVETLPDQENVRFAVELAGRELVVPSEPVTVPSGAFFIWPLARPIGRSVLLTATAQPVCVIDGAEPVQVLTQTAGIPVELVFDGATVTAIDGPATVTDGDDGGNGSKGGKSGAGGKVVVRDLRPGVDCLLRVTAADGSRAHVLVLDEENALTATRAKVWGRDRLILSSRPAVVDGDRLILYGGGPGDLLRVFPGPNKEYDGCEVIELPAQSVEALSAETVAPEAPSVKTASPGAGREFAEVEQVVAAGPARRPVIDAASGRASAPTDQDFEHAAVYRVTVPAVLLDSGEEVLLRLDWSGDVGRAYIGGRLVADRFWYGPCWEIGLRRFREELLEHGVIELRLLPFAQDAPVYVPPRTRGRRWPLELRSAEFVPVTRTVLEMK
ncbi:beta-galactosidase [Nonomuraea aurantiaca]|uniref:beta-galactosidase n=1 Tax=Nonomuraea aurantiaca TaxID=2878562 RepID=UPI001CD94C23|nr:beta-galactosidase [Nonomuraea aurantiaca]MCA2225186.1 beta-galactosidase [Nonomuraea aurantiaca]